MDDLISRDDVYDVLKKVSIREMPIYVFDKLWNGIRDLPSIEPERKTGKWIPVESQTVNGRCSMCGYESHLYENDVYGEHYCPNCGAWLRLE